MIKTSGKEQKMGDVTLGCKCGETIKIFVRKSETVEEKKQKLLVSLYGNSWFL